jgi:hypothetical protein
MSSDKGLGSWNPQKISVEPDPTVASSGSVAEGNLIGDNGRGA